MKKENEKENNKEIELPATAKPKMRELVVKTDGVNIEFGKVELSVLEIKEACRQILKRFGG